MLFPPYDGGIEALAVQRLAQLAFNLINQMCTVAARRAPRRFQTTRAHRIERFEAQILKLHAHFIHAEAHGNGCVYIESLAGNALYFFAVQHAQCAHVVQAIGELDQNDTDILCHSQGHFLKVFRLSQLYRVKLDMSEFADAIHKFCDFLAKLRPDIIFADAGVLYDIVQKRRHEALRVHVHTGKNAGNSKRMCNVGLSASSGLAVVGLFRVIVGAANPLSLFQW